MGGTRAVIVAVLALAGLAGCDGKEAAAPVKLDARLAGIYARTCETCHQNADTGAPQAHNLVQWKPRAAQGDAVLLDHVVNGFGGMPPLGQCIECTAEDLTALIHFMSSPAPVAQ
ncbi:MAG: c-type cytochrome [Parvibaculum sp.]|uniref:c-type cytochrome n=1 Tax=Parvibaculum sp. TaxID=2024848 RepID=UPI00283FC564|nr:c-type cytochrome [Parvibaculum sp.]MDR3497706.1 c-type cytochrome [Parvibaculum sp.]